MCLYTNQINPLIAKEDIIVYKNVVFVRSKKSEKFLMTAMYIEGFNYSREEKAYLRKKTGVTNSGHFRIPKINEISCGIHALTRPSEYECNSIWKIPKGAKYYEDNACTEIVSNRLEFVGLNKSYYAGSKDMERYYNIYHGDIEFVKFGFKKWLRMVIRYITAKK